MEGKPLVVIKVGTSTLMKVNSETGEQRVNLSAMGAIVETVTSLHQLGHGVIIVTSAAVGFGCLKLNLRERPKSVSLKQAAAAAGQSQLMRFYEDLFGVYGLKVAQILLSRFDFSAKDRFANVHNAIRELLDLRVIPIINENDTVSTEELRFGDNDTLSALVAVGVSADRLFLLTDVDCLYTANPRTNPDAKPVLDVSASELATIGGADSSGSGWGTGGMSMLSLTSFFSIRRSDQNNCCTNCRVCWDRSRALPRSLSGPSTELSSILGE
jgi:glutamate 5-kinase